MDECLSEQDLCRQSRYQKKRKVILGASTLIAAFLIWQILLGIYPGESFYEAEFERISGTDLPQSAEFVFTEASYPNHFGEYAACAIFEVDSADFKLLSQHIKTLRLRPRYDMSSECLNNLIEAHGRPLEFMLQTWQEKRSDGEYWHWGLLNDGRSIMFHYFT